MNVRPIAAKGSIALPDSLARLITVTDSVKPTVLVFVGILPAEPDAGVKSYTPSPGAVYGPRARRGARVARLSPVRGKLPIRIPPAYPIGHGLTIFRFDAGTGQTAGDVIFRDR